MSLLTIIQAAYKRVGLTAPSSAIGLTDANVVRMIELANEEGAELASRHRWQRLMREATLTTLATESQGLITTIAGADFGYMLDDTIWDRTSNRRWLPVDDVKWQQMKSSGITGPDVNFRLRGNYLLATPVPTASHTVAFEWITKYWCETSGGTGQAAWAADTDVARLDEGLMTAGLVWRWKASQGFEYAEDFRKYEILVNDAIARDGVKGHLHMGGDRAWRFIGRNNVSEGSWTI